MKETQGRELQIISYKKGGFLMKKYLVPALFFVLLVAFSGAVSGVATVDTYYTDANGNNITTAKVGDTVNVMYDVQNDATPVADAVLDAEWVNDMDWSEDESVYVSLDGGVTWTQDPTSVTWGEDDTFTWDIGLLSANQLAILRWPGIPDEAGSEVMTALLYDGDVLMDSDVASLIVNSPTPTPTPQAAAGSGKTVGMQTTGSPVGILLLAFALISVGLVYSKKK